jgi:hypothetical protein
MTRRVKYQETAWQWERRRRATAGPFDSRQRPRADERSRPRRARPLRVDDRADRENRQNSKNHSANRWNLWHLWNLWNDVTPSSI